MPNKPIFNPTSNGALTTSSVRSVPDDPQPLKRFHNIAARIEQRSLREAKPRHASAHEKDKLINVVDWDQQGSAETVVNIEGLENLKTSQARIIFAPRDVSVPERVFMLSELFKRYEIPSAFIAEGLQDVSQSFGARISDNGAEYIWFHFLVKNVTLSTDNGVHRIVDSGSKSNISQANFTWIKSGFVLKIDDPSKALASRNQTTSNSSTSPTPQTARPKQITMLCFEAPKSLYTRLKDLKEIASCDSLMLDPYILLDIALEEMYKLMDKVGWTVADIFGLIEQKTLGDASNLGKLGKGIDFTGLHNLAKHTIYLRENCDSALAILESLSKHHGDGIDKPPTAHQKATQWSLNHRKTMFQSTQRRLESLEKRMTNIIQLSFHLVTQRDSQSMKTIAVMTLIFMPLGTVAAVFGTQLIKLKDKPPYDMMLSRDFWIIWAIAAPLTILVVSIWLWWYRDLDANAQSVESRNGRMGWRSLNGWIDEAEKGQKRDEHMA